MGLSEFAAAVFTSTGDVPEGFNAISRVIGQLDEAHENWLRQLPSIHGRYGIVHVRDYFGFGKQSYADFFAPENSLSDPTKAGV